MKLKVQLVMSDYESSIKVGVHQGEVDGQTVPVSFLRKQESRVHQPGCWMPASAGMTTGDISLLVGQSSSEAESTDTEQVLYDAHYQLR
jgi:hypothetical protein